MANRLTKITTKQGDQGTTCLADGKRLMKNHPKIHAIGDVDELNSHLGLLHTEIDNEKLHAIKQLIIRFQHDLFDIGAELSLDKATIIEKHHVDFLDECISHYNQALPHLENFILPGGSPLIAQTHVARSVCRRAERQLVNMMENYAINSNSLIYLNRLSDLLFILARYFAKKQEIDHIIWQQRPPPK